jgi:hypothetical protein
VARNTEKIEDKKTRWNSVKRWMRWSGERIDASSVSQLYDMVLWSVATSLYGLVQSTPSLPLVNDDEDEDIWRESKGEDEEMRELLNTESDGNDDSPRMKTPSATRAFCRLDFWRQGGAAKLLTPLETHVSSMGDPFGEGSHQREVPR